jgi:cell division protein FtsZ
VQMPPAPPASDYAKRPPAPRAPTPDSLYKPRQGDLDPHGRPVPREARHGEDELEIPAFLRRQAN